MPTTESNVEDYRERGAPNGPPPKGTLPPREAYGRWEGKVNYADDPRRKSPALATLMSVMPGLGQVYVGYYQQGFINILVVATTITILSGGAVRGAEPLLGLFLAFYWLYNIVDAGRRASFYNQALAGLEPGALPEDIKLPEMRGSFAAGIALIIAGVIFFSNTMFNVPLEWLEDWWPVALIAAGAWLVYKSKAPVTTRDRAGAGSD
ncbi:MAG: LiaI-LiaF-like domain-containing protein [Vicinamibacterales bacterium]